MQKKNILCKRVIKTNYLESVHYEGKKYGPKLDSFRREKSTMNSKYFYARCLDVINVQI